jgi:hypothetical protein
LHNELTLESNDSDRIFVVFFHTSLDMPISIGSMKVSELTPQILSDEFIRVSQSKRLLRIDNNLEIRCHIAEVPTGGVLEKNLNTFKDRRSVITLKNRDNLCALRAFIIGKYICDGISRIDNYTRSNNRQVTSEISQTCKILAIEDKSLGLAELEKIELYYKNYQLTVYDKTCMINGKKSIPIYQGVVSVDKKFIYLLLLDNHYYVIRSPAKFFRSSNFCDYCKHPYEKKSFHNCTFICYACKLTSCKVNTYKFIKCDKCDILCNGSDCLNNHKNIICIPKKNCEICLGPKKFNHICDGDFKYCNNCRVQVDFDHKCFIVAETIKKQVINGYLFFDYETSQESGKHVPNLVICHVYDSNFVLKTKKYFYSNGEDINEDFCKWLFQKKNYIAIAHNLKGFDGVFIMNYLINHLRPDVTPPRIINIGNKMLSITFKNVKLIDSFCFLPMALSEFSSTFKLSLTKGYFPHFFNTIANQKFIGSCLPDKKYYGSDNFSVSKKNEFDIWYEENKNESFNFKKEFFSYCEADVDLLAQGCIAFHNIIQTVAKINPFANSSTLASLCHLIYRQNYMIPKSIAVIPEMGYNPYQNSSIKAKLWLKYICFSENRTLKHSLNGLEHRIGVYRLDGFSNGDAYEFHGCLYHGCIKCYNPSTFNPLRRELMSVTYERHCERIAFIKKNTKRLHEIWECDWDSLVTSNDEIKKFVKRQSFREPLSIRDALFGGRTNAAKLYHKTEHNEKIFHYDFTSLYPSVQRSKLYPVGHPSIITENFKNVNSYFGFIKCKVLAPQNLYFPILPVKLTGKLVFPLCFSCAVAKSTEFKCNHSIDERSFEGTWCTEEIKTALAHSYEILEIFEVYHWKESTDQMFRGYINDFLKIKQESSGFPKWVVTENDKILYQRKYLEIEKIQLDLDKISFNPGLRKISKLLLNTLWGRFGMNSNKSKIQIITKLDEWYKLLLSDQFKIHDVIQCNPEILQV